MAVSKKQGLRAEDSPYPLPELATGNMFRVKDELDLTDPLTGGLRPRWGVIVAHTQRNIFGVPMIQAVVYDDENRLVVDQSSNHIPWRFDFAASSFLLWRLHFHIGSNCYGPDGFDLYPDCEACKGTGNNPDNTEWCSTCGGSGHVTEMRRLPESMIPPMPGIPDEEMDKIVFGAMATVAFMEQLQEDLRKVCTPHGVEVVTEIHGAPANVTVQVKPWDGEENALEVILFSGRFSNENEEKGEAVDAELVKLLHNPPYEILKQTRGIAFGNSYVVRYIQAPDL